MIHLYYYVAGCLEQVEEARKIAFAVEASGSKVVSRWHDNYVDMATDLAMSPSDRETVANENLRDLCGADGLIWLADKRSRGALVEVGYAIGLAIDITAIGNPRDVTPMASHRRIEWFETFEAAMEAVI